MIFLSIETSCDETSLAIIDTGSNTEHSKKNFSVKSSLTVSQINLHEQYGGVFPALAKREHSENLVPLLIQTLSQANMINQNSSSNIIDTETLNHVQKILDREPILYNKILEFLALYKKPAIDGIFVTYGPGLSPALWVGINFARALSKIWNIPIVPVNHMEGHITSILYKENYLDKDKALYPIENFKLPIIALLISGGHTQLVLVRSWGQYEIIGETLDDAVGEAFDKVARMLGMTYPGGPKILQAAITGISDENIKLPRPMLNSDNYQFSFSGLKTAVRYLIERLGGLGNLDSQTVSNIAAEFQNSVADVLLHKTKQALVKNEAQGLIIAGGVAANNHIRIKFQEMISTEFPDVNLFIPKKNLCGDNSLMIASAGFVQYLNKKEKAFIPESEIKAVSNLKL